MKLGTVALPEDGFIRQRELLKIVPVVSSTLWRWVAAGSFPQPIKIGPACTAWRIEDVRAWIAAQGALNGDVGKVR